MRRSLAALAVLAVAGLAGLGVLVAWPLDRGPKIDGTLVGDPNRGAYLARASGCIGCHTDIENGGPPLAGGPPIVTEFGTFRDFATAVRRGISPEGYPYYPAFPYEFYTKLPDQDVAYRSCQTNANWSQYAHGCRDSGCAELPPVFQGGGAIELEDGPA